jgi:hypothetical protein
MAKDKTKEVPAVTPAPAGAGETRAIAPVQPRQLVSIPRDGGIMAVVQTNINSSTLAGKAMLLAARSPSDIEFSREGIAEILATHWAIFPDRGVNEETGEESEFVRTVLFDRHGRTFRTTSERAPERVYDLTSLFSPAEWAAGIPVVILQRRSTKTGRTFHDFRLNTRGLSHDGAA